MAIFHREPKISMKKGFSQLSPSFYDDSCPDALKTIKSVVEAKVQREFHIGCDGSILLDSTSSIDSEKNAKPIQSAQGFDVVDKIKEAVDQACGQPVVSCTDILAVAARDAVVASGGPTWEVQLGRRDSTTASREAAEANIPAPSSNLSQLISIFNKHDLDEKDLVALSGAHTIGYALCVSFRDRIYNDPNIDSSFAQQLKYICPRHGGDRNRAPFDTTPMKFDTTFFSDLVQMKGLLHSDQELYNGGSVDALVEKYSNDAAAFFQDFVIAIKKLQNIRPLTGDQGEIRDNCRTVN